MLEASNASPSPRTAIGGDPPDGLPELDLRATQQHIDRRAQKMNHTHGRLRGLLSHAWAWLIRQIEQSNNIKLRPGAR